MKDNVNRITYRCRHWSSPCPKQNSLAMRQTQDLSLKSISGGRVLHKVRELLNTDLRALYFRQPKTHSRSCSVRQRASVIELHETQLTSGRFIVYGAREVFSDPTSRINTNEHIISIWGIASAIFPISYTGANQQIQTPNKKSKGKWNRNDNPTKKTLESGTASAPNQLPT